MDLLSPVIWRNINFVLLKILVSRVINTYGPQTRNQDAQVSNHNSNTHSHDCGNQAIEERLQNIEAHLRLQTG